MRERKGKEREGKVGKGKESIGEEENGKEGREEQGNGRWEEREIKELTNSNEGMLLYVKYKLTYLYDAAKCKGVT